jgi:hypothetical protein
MAPSKVSKLAQWAVTEIVEDGDLLLVVGTGKAHQRLKVPYRVLTLASAEFGGMIEDEKLHEEEAPIAKSSNQLKLYLSSDNSEP